MACDPKKIFTDLQVIGAVLTYACGYQVIVRF